MCQKSQLPKKDSAPEGGEKNMETDEKLSLEQILGKQTKVAISKHGIHNLRVEDNGSISGERPNPYGLSAIQIHNISLYVRRDMVGIFIHEDWGDIERDALYVPSGKLI